jgi:hypothetical protein
MVELYLVKNLSVGPGRVRHHYLGAANPDSFGKSFAARCISSLLGQQQKLYAFAAASLSLGNSS